MLSFRCGLMLLCLGTAVLLIAALRQVPGNQSTYQPVKKMLPVVSEKLKVPTVKPSSHLVVDLSDRRVYVYKANKVFSSYPVGVGKHGWETPVGKFKVLDKQHNPAWIHPITGEVISSGPSNPLGERWIGFWSDGRHQIGFHGTNKESLVGQPVTHGCLRMRNQDIRQLYEQVSEGTIVTVRK